ncbi:MAG: hypothetical protein ACYDB9_02065 [Gammaproteobacteria bacterium]
MSDMPLNQKDGSTPGAPLPDNKPREREAKPLPPGTPGWLQIPKFPVPDKKEFAS